LLSDCFAWTGIGFMQLPIMLATPSWMWSTIAAVGACRYALAALRFIRRALAMLPPGRRVRSAGAQTAPILILRHIHE